MLRLRLCFEKTGRAIYLSHLDLMRTFQRAFFRARIRVWHTEGFNPQLYLSMVQPLSLGFHGFRELMDVQWEEGAWEDLPERLNAALPEGIRVLSCWEAKDKAKLVSMAEYRLRLTYDNGVGENECLGLIQFYGQEQILVMKKTKRGQGEADIRPQIIKMEGHLVDEHTVELTAFLAAGTTVLNPSYLVSALPEHMRPDFCEISRMGLYREDFSELR